MPKTIESWAKELSDWSDHLMRWIKEVTDALNSAKPTREILPPPPPPKYP